MHQGLIKIAGQGVAEGDESTYLGATVFKEGGGVKDQKNRISKRVLKATNQRNKSI